jgi:hypothetical protein
MTGTLGGANSLSRRSSLSAAAGRANVLTRGPMLRRCSGGCRAPDTTSLRVARRLRPAGANRADGKLSPFNDWHSAMAYLGAGRESEVERLVRLARFFRATLGDDGALINTVVVSREKRHAASCASDEQLSFIPERLIVAQPCRSALETAALDAPTKPRRRWRRKAHERPVRTVSAALVRRPLQAPVHQQHLPRIPMAATIETFPGASRNPTDALRLQFRGHRER